MMCGFVSTKCPWCNSKALDWTVVCIGLFKDNAFSFTPWPRQGLGWPLQRQRCFRLTLSGRLAPSNCGPGPNTSNQEELSCGCLHSGICWTAFPVPHLMVNVVYRWPREEGKIHISSHTLGCASQLGLNPHACCPRWQKSCLYTVSNSWSVSRSRGLW